MKELIEVIKNEMTNNCGICQYSNSVCENCDECPAGHICDNDIFPMLSNLSLAMDSCSNIANKVGMINPDSFPK